MTPTVDDKRLMTMVATPETPLVEAIARLDKGGAGIVLLCNRRRRLLGVLTDGDVRRAILHGLDLQQPSVTIATKDPITARPNISMAEALQIMNTGKGFPVNQLPLVDDEGRLRGILLRRDLSADLDLPLSAVIMAGGFGTRLLPLTADTPKPMLPLGDRPLLEVIMKQLRESGIRRVHVSTHYKGDAITQHFGNGAAFGLSIAYVNEQRPLGTAGALGLMATPEEPLLVINGDVVTRLDFRAMLDFHTHHHADMTVAVRQHEHRVPFGVVKTSGVRITSIVEKPVTKYFINAGIYLLSTDACRRIPAGEHYDMTDLIAELLADGRCVVGFPVREYWKDIGQIADYQQAQQDLRNGTMSS